jgi:hypothetical protein
MFDAAFDRKLVQYFTLWGKRFYGFKTASDPVTRVRIKRDYVLPLKSYCFRKLFIGGGNCIPHVGKPINITS